MTFDIIVPYRNREDHLRKFIPHYTALYPEANILIIEQANDLPFNRGWLLNVGFILSSSDYVIFHDVDMLIVNGFQHYRKPVETVAQLATHAEQFMYRMPFPQYLGGVTMYSRDFFKQVNGYSNKFWGYGSEDNEMYDNVVKQGKIEYRNCWYKSLPHERAIEGFCLPKDHPNYQYWKKGRDRDDGLSFCEYSAKEKYVDRKVTHWLASMPDTQGSPQPAA